MRPITCPSCRDDLSLADLRPGRFRIACPRCASSLIVTVPDRPEGDVTVAVEPMSTSAPTPAAEDQTDFNAHAIRSGWVGRYRVVGPNQGRAWGVGPVVDLNVVRDRWRTDARFVAAWTLEALAAAELRHPNLDGPAGVDLVGDRIFAVGPVCDLAPLSDPTTRSSFARNGRVAAVLHAARGLRCAHEQGVYARDLSLGSIRVDPSSLIRLAGLGVNRTPSDSAPPVVEPIPLADPGTPAPPPPPMPARPEVQTDLAGLGRTFSTLVAGSSHDRAVPPGLATLIRRLGGEGTATIDPRERFTDAGAAVRALEVELGVAGPLQPIESEVEAFEAALEAYQAAPLLPLRKWLGVGSVGLLGLIVVSLLMLGRIIPAIGWVGFGGLIAAALAAFRVADARRRISGRLAGVMAVVSRRDLITVGVVVLLGLTTLWATHWLVTGLIVTTIAVGLAAVWHWGLDRPLAASRSDSLGRLRELVRGWRLLGFDEESIRRHVATASGSAWEEVFAALFGLGAVGSARGRWGGTLSGGRRPRFAPIQAWWLGRLDLLMAGRRDARTREWLEPILERDHEARGTQTLTARRRAKRGAEAVVAVLGQFRRSTDGSVGLPLADALRQAVARPEDFLSSPEIATDGEPAAWRPMAAALVQAFGGSRARFLLGAACLAASFVWMEQNSLVSYEEGKQAMLTAAVEGDRALAVDRAKRIGQKFVEGVARVIDAPGEAETMRLGVLSPEVAQHLNGFALATSGLILLISCLTGGFRIIPVALIAALLPLTPRLVVPSARPLDFASLVAMAVGVGIFVVGRIWARGEE